MKHNGSRFFNDNKSDHSRSHDKGKDYVKKVVKNRILRYSVSTMSSIKSTMLIRQNARHPQEARELRLNIQPVTGVDGACEVALGDTKVCCTVECQPELNGLHVVFNESGKMKWKRLQGHSTYSNLSEYNVETWVKKSIESSIVVSTNQDAGWLLILDAITDDGSLEAACTIAATMALTTAIQQRATREGPNGSLHVRHSVVAVTCGMFGGNIAVDLDKGEMNAAEILAQFAITSHGHIVRMNLETQSQDCPTNMLSAMTNIAIEQAKRYFQVMNAVMEEPQRDRSQRKAFWIG